LNSQPVHADDGCLKVGTRVKDDAQIFSVGTKPGILTSKAIAALEG
jgi:hypothetical protein